VGLGGVNNWNKKPYIFSPNWWGLDGGSWRIYRAEIPVKLTTGLTLTFTSVYKTYNNFLSRVNLVLMANVLKLKIKNPYCSSVTEKVCF
jgi:hypothetical protein